MSDVADVDGLPGRTQQNAPRFSFAGADEGGGEGGEGGGEEVAAVHGELLLSAELRRAK